MTEGARTSNGVKTICFINDTGKIGWYVQKKIKLDHLLPSYTRINSKWIKDWNERFKTIKILEENIGSKILDIYHSNIFSDISPWARETKEKKMKLD